MKRICIIQDYLRRGGTETQSLHLAKSLSQAGNDVTLLTFCRGGDLEMQVEREFYQHISLREKVGGAVWWAPNLRKELIRQRAETVILMGRNANHWGWYISLRLPSIKVIATCRTGRNLWWPYRRTLQVADEIIVNSQFLERILKSNFSSLPPIFVLHNALTRGWDIHAVEQERENLRLKYDISPTTKVFLNVQMFRFGKNKKELIRIFSEIDKHLDWKLWLVGDGPELQVCKDLVAQYELEDRIHFFDAVEDPFAFYCASDAVVSTSLEESLPNQFVEAQTVGRYVICYDVAGSRECFEQASSGMAHPVGERSGFKESVLSVLQEPSFKQDEVQTIAREFAKKNFSADGQSQKLLSLVK